MNHEADSWEATVTAPDQAYYQQVYQYEGENKSQDAMTAFLRHAQDVSPQQLNQILGAAFQVNTSNVADNKRSFYMALKLIACAQHGINPSSPILSTSTPLPIFKDYELITTKDRQKYLRIFHASSPTDGLINGDQAMKILMRSKLPVSLLSHIWNLADMDRQGKLDSTGFVIAMHYVAKCMSGNTSLPHANAPDSILKSARGESPSLATMTTSKPSPRTTDKLGPTSPPPRPPPPAPPASAPAPPVSTTATSTPDQLPRSTPDIFSPLTQNHPWNVDKTEIDAYNHAFNTIDTGNKGYIEGSEAVGFFGHSNLPPSDLAGVWDLADTQNRGQLSQDEFAIAMHLIRRVRGGSPLPTTLPASMLSHFQSKNKEALTARVNHLQETIAKEQEDLPEIQQAAKDQENVVSDLQKQVDALEQSLQQVVQQKSDLQAALDTLKKSEHDKRRKITLLEKEYNTTQTELVSLKAAHQQQLALAGVSTSQLVAAQSLKDKSAQELALAQSGQFDKISDMHVKSAETSPPPPPPSSRHHRTQSFQASQQGSTGSPSRKPPAPPPSKKKRTATPSTTPIEKDNQLTSKDLPPKEDSVSDNVPIATAVTAGIATVVASAALADVIKTSASVPEKDDHGEQVSLGEPNVEKALPETLTDSPDQNETTTKALDQPHDAVVDEGNKDLNETDNVLPETTTIPDEAAPVPTEELAPLSTQDTATTLGVNDDRSTDISKNEGDSVDGTKDTVIPTTIAGDDLDTAAKEAVTEHEVTGAKETATDDEDSSDSGDSSDDEEPAKETPTDGPIGLNDDRATEESTKKTPTDTLDDTPLPIATEDDVPKETTTDPTLPTNDNHVEEAILDKELTHDDRDKTAAEPSELTKVPDLTGATKESTDATIGNSDKEGMEQQHHTAVSTEQPELPLAADTNEDTASRNHTETDGTSDTLLKEPMALGESGNDKQPHLTEPVRSIDNLSTTAATGSPEIHTATTTATGSMKGDDHDFEVVDNASASSSFMSASMGADDDALDEFDAAFSETLPDAKMVSSTTTTTTTTTEPHPATSSNTDGHFDVDDFDDAFDPKVFSPSNAQNATTSQLPHSDQQPKLDDYDPFATNDDGQHSNAFADTFAPPPATASDKKDAPVNFADTFAPPPATASDKKNAPVNFADAFGDSFTATGSSADDAQKPTTTDTSAPPTAAHDDFMDFKELVVSPEQVAHFESNPFDEPSFEHQPDVTGPEEPSVDSSMQQPIKEITPPTQESAPPQQSSPPPLQQLPQQHSDRSLTNDTPHTPTTPRNLEPAFMQPPPAPVSPSVSTASNAHSDRAPRQPVETRPSKTDIAVEEPSHTTSPSKGKHKGLFSLSSMLPKQKGKKSKSKSKKDKAPTIDEPPSSEQPHQEPSLEATLPAMSDQEVMANLREFGVDNESMQTLTNMGFTMDQAKEALERYDYDVQKATNFLLDQ
ncbi:hypothetical protein [Absidia glauca]|uniref:Actin cytoskeleton-regulatory complex protein pan1 n=1 Tax=Absidia glauca TaxID=4829 RepID=A0A168PXU4_ABSGL|nr:hypothetical protein [Absidia glauca]